MLSCINKHARPKAKRGRTLKKDLDLLYRQLSQSLELAHMMNAHFDDESNLLCLAVLEEDLEALLEECEELFILGQASTPAVESLHTRSETILEELRNVIVPYQH